MKLNQLQALIAIAETGSISRAADRLGISQPALSKSIQALEREVGVELFVRRARGVSLTIYGNAVLKRSLAVQREIQKAHEELAWLQGVEGGNLSIGLTPVAADQSVANAIAEIRKRKPDIRVELSELRPSQILKGLKTGRYDIGLMTLYGAASVDGFQCQLIKSLPVGLACGLPRPDTASLQDLFTREWIDYDPRDGTASYIDALVEVSGHEPPKRRVHCTSLLLALQLAVKLGAVCAISQAGFPFIEGRPELRSLALIRPDFAMPAMNVVVVFPEWEGLTPAAQAFVRSLRLSG